MQTTVPGFSKNLNRLACKIDQLAYTQYQLHAYKQKAFEKICTFFWNIFVMLLYYIKIFCIILFYIILVHTIA